MFHLSLAIWLAHMHRHMHMLRLRHRHRHMHMRMHKQSCLLQYLAQNLEGVINSLAGQTAYINL